MTAWKKNTIWPELAAILLVRLGILWLIVLISLLLPTDDILFYAFIGIAFICTIPYALWLKNRLRAIEFAPLQFIVDLVMVSGLVYFTGGTGSCFTLLYPLVILAAGIVGTPKQAVGISLLGIGFYLLMGVMLHYHLLVAYVSVIPMMTMNNSLTSILLRSLSFAGFGGLSIYIAKRCNFSNNPAAGTLSHTVSTILQGIPVPALLLAPDGRMLFANEPACLALNTTADKLRLIRFSELRQDPEKPFPGALGCTTTLIREGSTPLPVTYTTKDVTVPPAALTDSGKRSLNNVQVTILVFSDISHALKTHRQLEKIERVTNATRIASEMAHEIQAPLANLSASVQLLRHYEEKATAADWLPSSPRRIDRKELFNHIEDASSQMDSVIRNFIDFAEFSPQDLLSIIKLDSTDENQGYIGHLNAIGRGLTDGQDSHSG